MLIIFISLSVKMEVQSPSEGDLSEVLLVFPFQEGGREKCIPSQVCAALALMLRDRAGG